MEPGIVVLLITVAFGFGYFVRWQEEDHEQEENQTRFD